MVAYEDMYDGMVLHSVTGYPLLIQMDPLRINNNNIIQSETNLFFKNGIVHTTSEFPMPRAAWFGKSLYDVLLETNQARQGDLSAFIGLIDRSPDIQTFLREGDEGLTGTTLFAPTNDALASVLEGNMTADPMVFEEFLKNHLVSGNFVRRCWEIIPSGTHISDTELRLDTEAGRVLTLEITEDVMINGTVRIIREDILSEMGVMHVIDKPLLLWR
jgi:uncharacterized surface protein with fasciclin (FAS1) repeats